MRANSSFAALLVALAFGALVTACDDHAPREKSAPRLTAPTDDVRVSPLSGVVIPDVELQDQDGHAIRLPAALGDGAFAVQFVFTTCTTICSPMTAVFARLANDLGEGLGRDVRLLSITLDPAVDGPAELKRYADRFGRRDGWTFLTGKPERLSRVLRALGGEARAKEEHRPLTILGDGHGKFVLLDGLSSAARLGAELTALRSSAKAAGGGCRDLDSSARRGKMLYQRGHDAEGKRLVGMIGDGPASLSGESAACSGCHGPSGDGSQEGSLAAPPLTPPHLFGDPLEGSRPGSYTDATFAAAVRQGSARGARRLSATMPRFQLDEPDLRALTAYLHCIGHEREPGVTDGAIRIGVAWPMSGPNAAQGAALSAATSLALEDLEAPDGTFRRRIELVIEDTYGAEGEDGALQRLARRDVFALLASAPASGPLLDQDGEEIPHIAPLGVAPSATTATRTFYVRPGPDLLSRIAVSHAARSRSDATILVLVPDDRAGAAMSEAATLEASQRGLPAPFVLRSSPGGFDSVASLAAVTAYRPTAILFGGTAEELGRFARAFPAEDLTPIYAPAAILGDHAVALDPATARRTLLLHTGLVDERVPRMARAIEARLQSLRVAPGNAGLAASAEVATRVLIEGLRRSGARPSRHGLVSALEGLRDFEAGLSPPLSYSRSRHVGVMGAYVVKVEPATKKVVRISDWISASPR